MPALRPILRSALGRLLRALWPDACAGCGVLCGEHGLCPACAEAIRSLGSGPRCRRCGAVLGPYAAERAGCASCAGRPLRLGRVLSLGPHQGVLREAVRRLKFGRRASGARPLGRLLAERVREAEVRADVVVPVPSDPARERARGFNQAAAVAEAVARELGLTLAAGAVRRVRAADGSQTALGLLDRAAAVAHAFAPAPGARAQLAGRRVLLVDDVLTTGSTLSACADACRAAGARSVVGACVARRHGRRPMSVGT